MLLLAEKEDTQDSVRCFELLEGALFVEAGPATDISRRITAFQYELVSSEGPGGHMYPYLQPSKGKAAHTACPSGHDLTTQNPSFHGIV